VALPHVAVCAMQSVAHPVTACDHSSLSMTLDSPLVLALTCMVEVVTWPWVEVVTCRVEVGWGEAGRGKVGEALEEETLGVASCRQGTLNAG
jgi:hypothetical protein